MTDKMMRIAGQNDQNRARPIQTDRDGNIQIISLFSNTIVERKQGDSSFYIDVAKGNSVTIFLSNPNDDPNTFYFEGIGSRDRKVRGTVPVIDSNLILRTDPLSEEGIYYIDVSGFEELGVRVRTSSITATINVVVSTSPCPQPIDSPVKYQRITSEDGLVVGKFRAIEPITDITLHEDTSLLGEYHESSVGATVFETGDERKQGHTIFGPFSRVHLDYGTALLVLL